MIYLFYQSWNNTVSNHAGMKYMCQKLEELYPEKYKAIEVAKEKIHNAKSGILNRALNYFFRPVRKLLSEKKIKKSIESLNLTSTDIAVLIEYMDKHVNQLFIAKKIKEYNRRIRVVGFSHLVPSKLDEQFNKNELELWMDYVDGLVTLGSSLTEYYKKNGIDSNKIKTLYHYIDDYYLVKSINNDWKFKVLAQGNQMRDIDTLSEIICNNKDINFVVCQGVNDLSKKLGFENVRLLPFLDESELRDLMSECPVSLNVMKDTIGSNVIVTSMGMGQAMVCSDVGSIRDYCNFDNSMLCKTVDDFSHALNSLKTNTNELLSLRKKSATAAIRFRLISFEKDFYEFLNS